MTDYVAHPETTLNADFKKVLQSWSSVCSSSPFPQIVWALKNSQAVAVTAIVYAIVLHPQLIKNITHHIRSSSDFIQTISSLMAGPEDIMVSFRVNSMA
jgi:hypothetical protein